MQKDIHYYGTSWLLRQIGVRSRYATLVAWANQFTDEQTKATKWVGQTQCAVSPGGNWNDRTIQERVLCAFHFLPSNTWVVEPCTHRAATSPPGCAALMRHIQDSFLALRKKKDLPHFLIQLGIALHTLQDTFSHQGWTGWKEQYNSCFGWDNLLAGLIPSVGHSDMQRVPDIITAAWTDPRNGQYVDNTARVYASFCRLTLWLTDNVFGADGGSLRIIDELFVAPVIRPAPNPSPLANKMKKTLAPLFNTFSTEIEERKRFFMKDYHDFPRYKQAKRSRQSQATLTSFNAAVREQLAAVLPTFPTEHRDV